ncbi:MAG: DEAD/DEAH box helicase [Chloroflexota bacterium]|nr:DEAD/DEAH box helicase [Chloroflexota bacterium]
MTISSFIEHLKTQPFYKGQITHVHHLPARSAQYSELDSPLPERLVGALNESNVERLYSHQAQAINAVRRGENVIASTSTASGKTLIYNLPVLESILADWRARALYIFPTKALAQDQLRALGELTQGALRRIRYATYDGDTPKNDRSRRRKECAIILTNPDMLHLGILPNHTLWSHFFRNLRYVVIDEAHTYRGVFGSQVACVLRRLRRVCRSYGAHPQFILCSATIANPGEHAARLTGLPATVIDEDGSPQGAREFVLWNPPFVDRARTMRRSPNGEAAYLLAEMARRSVRNITFTRARRVAELILIYARRELEKDAADLVECIRSYRAGYLPEERREIERQLFHGELLGVTATNALELGIDVGSLDATVLVGYPGTIASLWQQAGRAGRGVREALSILIGLNGPLDQHFMRHPEDLFGRPHEHALIDPGNAHLLEMQLPCAAHEMPLESRDEELFGPGFEEAMVNLEERGVLEYRHERWFNVGSRYPAQDFSLRSASGHSVLLVDEARGGQVLEEIESTSALTRVHPGAVYLHQGESYLVRRLDLNRGHAYLRPVEVNYYTQPRELNDVHIVRSLRDRDFPATHAYFGPVRITQQVIGYTRRQQFTEAVLSVEDLDLPPESFDTMALWFDVPRPIAQRVTDERLDFAGGLHAVEHAAIAMLPLFAMCDRMDIGGLSTPVHPDTGRAQVFIYDAFPGGVGIAEKGFELLEQLWRATLQTIEECPCEAGCPSCVQSPKCGNNNEPLDKVAAAVILRALLGQD